MWWDERMHALFEGGSRHFQRGYDDFLKLIHEEIVWKAIAVAFDEPRAKGGSQLPFGSKVTPCLGVIARVSFPRER